jgi:hypothetical protein
MSDQPAQQPQTISQEGLTAFYTEFGSKAHALHEAVAQLQMSRQREQQAMTLLEQAQSERDLPPNDPTGPTPIEAREKSAGG